MNNIDFLTIWMVLATLLIGWNMIDIIKLNKLKEEKEQ